MSGLRVKVPIYRASCLALVAGVAVALGGCYATVTRYQADGKTPASVAKVPLGMEYDVTTDKLTGDPKAIEAMGVAGSKVIDVAGDELARYAIEKAAEASNTK